MENLPSDRTIAILENNAGRKTSSDGNQYLSLAARHVLHNLRGTSVEMERGRESSSISFDGPRKGVASPEKN